MLSCLTVAQTCFCPACQHARRVAAQQQVRTRPAGPRVQNSSHTSPARAMER